MYCPVCGQQQLSDETRYCSKCGFLLTGVGSLVTNEGLIPGAPDLTSGTGISPRKRGIRQGLFIFLLTFLVVPIISILTVAVNAEPYLVAISAIIFFVGGLLRMAYSLMFESAESTELTVQRSVLAETQNHLRGSAGDRILPSPQSVPASAYVSPPAAGHWRDTKDLEPVSVTDNTTKLLQDQVDDQ